MPEPCSGDPCAGPKGPAFFRRNARPTKSCSLPHQTMHMNMTGHAAEAGGAPTEAADVGAEVLDDGLQGDTSASCSWATLCG